MAILFWKRHKHSEEQEANRYETASDYPYGTLSKTSHEYKEETLDEQLDNALQNIAQLREHFQKQLEQTEESYRSLWQKAKESIERDPPAIQNNRLWRLYFQEIYMNRLLGHFAILAHIIIKLDALRPSISMARALRDVDKALPDKIAKDISQTLSNIVEYANSLKALEMPQVKEGEMPDILTPEESGRAKERLEQLRKEILGEVRETSLPTGKTRRTLLIGPQ